MGLRGDRIRSVGNTGETKPALFFMIGVTDIRQKEVLALSVRQPWAWAIVKGFKDVENRTWSTKYRGLVYIHAPKKVETHQIDYVIHCVSDTLNEDSDVYQEWLALYKEEAKTGGLVGVAWINDCQPHSYERHGLSNQWAFGPQCWELDTEKAEMFERMVPCKGKLGLWKPEPGIYRNMDKAYVALEMEYVDLRQRPESSE